ncbi:hypothetical protein KR018_005793 [Drosophila ironensis]|nr:hypothetical protein KR018_005793 [Drosophila ironensis]
MKAISRRLLRLICWIRRTEGCLCKCLQDHRRMLACVLHTVSVLSLFSIISFLAVYDMYYVLPEIFNPAGPVYMFHWGLLIFILHNILGNMWKQFSCDTSVRSLAKDRQRPSNEEASAWHHCTICHLQVPPRSWHCKVCNCCILKRDHHCTFAANCIGHNNQRYFIGFLFYLCFGSGLALIYNGIHIWQSKALIASDMMFLIGSNAATDSDDFSWKFTIATIFKLNIFIFITALFMFGLQMFLVNRNSTCYRMLDRTYDLGWRRNIRGVLGTRLFWTFISPAIESPLPHDGSQWQAMQSLRQPSYA